MDAKRDDLKARVKAFLKKRAQQETLEVLRDGPDGDKPYRINGVRKMTPQEFEQQLEYDAQQSILAYCKGRTAEESAGGCVRSVQDA